MEVFHEAMQDPKREEHPGHDALLRHHPPPCEHSQKLFQNMAPGDFTMLSKVLYFAARGYPEFDYNWSTDTQIMCKLPPLTGPAGLTEIQLPGGIHHQYHPKRISLRPIPPWIWSECQDPFLYCALAKQADDELAVDSRPRHLQSKQQGNDGKFFFYPDPLEHHNPKWGRMGEILITLLPDS
jgi:hypothetical protein